MTDDERYSILARRVIEDNEEIRDLRKLAWDSAVIAQREYETLALVSRACIASAEAQIADLADHYRTALEQAQQERDTARWDDAERGELLLRIERLTRERDALREAGKMLYDALLQLDVSYHNLNRLSADERARNTRRVALASWAEMASDD